VGVTRRGCCSSFHVGVHCVWCALRACTFFSVQVLSFLSTNDVFLGAAAVVVASFVVPTSPTFCVAIAQGGAVLPLCRMALLSPDATKTAPSGTGQGLRRGRRPSRRQSSGLARGIPSASGIPDVRRIVSVLATLNVTPGAVLPGSDDAVSILQVFVDIIKVGVVGDVPCVWFHALVE